MAITNLKELVAAISDPTSLGTVVARGVDTGTLRVNPLAQTLTNIDAVTSTQTLTVAPLTSVIDVGTTAVRTVAAGESVILITGPQGARGQTGDQGITGEIGAQGIQGEIGPQGIQGETGLTGSAGVSPLPISGFEVDHDGNLIAIFDDSTIINAGNVVGPPPVFTIGTVVAAAAPSVTISGTPPNYVLDFELQTGATGPNIPIVVNTTSGAQFFPVMASAPGGTFSTATITNTKLYYVPASGTHSATIHINLSDQNQKTNIKNIDDALNIIENLNGVRFNWKDNNMPSAGLIAQDVEKYLPELVDSTTGEFKALNYNGIIGVLVEAVKDLSSRIKTLEQD
jgi:hypothetical protein